MPQVFTPRSNNVARAVVFGSIPALVILLLVGIALARSSLVTGKGRPIPQPVPFSHAQHVGALAVDCRYCHVSVEESAFAGIPPTETCMTCHSQLSTGSDALAPVRESWEEGEPLRWRRVHDLPDFVYFHHGIHVSRGVGCVSCHGRVDQMVTIRQVRSLHMKWCVDCHRDPSSWLRPPEHVFDMAWRDPEHPSQTGRKLMARYGIDTASLADCSICHR